MEIPVKTITVVFLLVVLESANCQNGEPFYTQDNGRCIDIFIQSVNSKDTSSLSKILDEQVLIENERILDFLLSDSTSLIPIIHKEEIIKRFPLESSRDEFVEFKFVNDFDPKGWRISDVLVNLNHREGQKVYPYLDYTDNFISVVNSIRNDEIEYFNFSSEDDLNFSYLKSLELTLTSLTTFMTHYILAKSGSETDSLVITSKVVPCDGNLVSCGWKIFKIEKLEDIQIKQVTMDYVDSLKSVYENKAKILADSIEKVNNSNIAIFDSLKLTIVGKDSVINQRNSSIIDLTDRNLELIQDRDSTEMELARLKVGIERIDYDMKKRNEFARFSITMNDYLQEFVGDNTVEAQFLVENDRLDSYSYLLDPVKCERFAADSRLSFEIFYAKKLFSNKRLKRGSIVLQIQSSNDITCYVGRLKRTKNGIALEQFNFELTGVTNSDT